MNNRTYEHLNNRIIELKTLSYLAIVLAFITGVTLKTFAQEKIIFKSGDSLEITSEWYKINENGPVILLCHQARSSRGEYSKIAPMLNATGFNCLAIDLRSGDKMQGITNETAQRARIKKLQMDYLSAEQDILAGINFLFKKAGKPIILMGSSYSASLALKIAVTNEKVSAVIAFSPGEHFQKKLDVKNAIKDLNKLAFISSTQGESRIIRNLIGEMIHFDKINHYVPQREGKHGALALSKTNPNHEEYWVALKTFLEKLK